MGNSGSKNSNSEDKKHFNDLYEVMDYIATYYILTMDFQSLKKLTEKEYCNNLVILTSDIIKKYFNDLDITYLAQRIKNGAEVNELMKEHVTFLTKTQFDSLDVKNDKQKNIKKKRACIGIAKFYIKIAHIFSAIIMTINPVYSYKDANGINIETPLMLKDTIPKNTQRTLKKLNICQNRINILKPKQNKLQNEESNDTNNNNNNDNIINPKFCEMNLDKNNNLKTLADEPGIKELMNLYFDVYDYSTGSFTSMSKESQAAFAKDLKTFYTAFTGKEDMPPEITNFSDIKLKDYNSMSGCQGDKPKFKTAYAVNKNDKLFVDYAKNISNMINTTYSKQNELLEIINMLFTYVIDPYSGKKKIRVNPKLTEELLQKVIENARRIIIQLYVKCEYDFLQGLKLYETIVEMKIIQTTENQIKNLNKMKDDVVTNAIKPIQQIPIQQQQQFPIQQQQIPIQQQQQFPIQQQQQFPIQQQQFPIQQQQQFPIQEQQFPIQQQQPIQPSF